MWVALSTGGQPCMPHAATSLQEPLFAARACCVSCFRYVGMFKDGQRHGEGTLYYSSGARYEGQWQRGRKHGQGVYVFEDGSVFSGQFLDDRPVLATGAVLGAESTFAAAAAPAGSATMHSTNGELQGSTAGAAAARSSSSNSALARAGLDVPGKEDNQGPAQLAASAQGATKPTPTARIGAPAVSKAVGRAGSASASTSGSAASKPAARNAAARTGSASSPKPADAAAAAATSQRASTAASSASSASSATSRAGTASSLGQNAALDSSSSSSPGSSSFGPATSVMQLCISDLLLEYDAQPAAVYKAVSNLLVGCSTELRLLYDRYR